MAKGIIVTCPECGDKFKSNSDKEGKKIRCPECDETFRLTERLISYPKGSKPPPPKAKPAKPAKASKTPVAEPEPEPEAPFELVAETSDEFDDDGNPYNLTHVEMKPRCPACAKEMPDAKAFICLNCGYNTLTREVGRTEKLIGATFEEQLAHLTPALSSLAFAIFLVIVLLWYCITFPAQFGDQMTWTGFILNNEKARLPITIVGCFLLFFAGSYAFNQIIFEPKPKEKRKD